MHACACMCMKLHDKQQTIPSERVSGHNKYTYLRLCKYTKVSAQSYIHPIHHLILTKPYFFRHQGKPRCTTAVIGKSGHRDRVAQLLTQAEGRDPDQSDIQKGKGRGIGNHRTTAQARVQVGGCSGEMRQALARKLRIFPTPIPT